MDSKSIGGYYVLCILILSTPLHLLHRSIFLSPSKCLFLPSNVSFSLQVYFSLYLFLVYLAGLSHDMCAHKHALKTATHTGTCTSSGVCTCDAGRWGNTCQNNCPGGEMNSCNGHGMCGLRGTCSCWQGWTGWSCGRLLGAFGLALLARLDGSLVGSQVPSHPPPFCCLPFGGTLVSMVQPALVMQLAAPTLHQQLWMPSIQAPSPWPYGYRLIFWRAARAHSVTFALIQNVCGLNLLYSCQGNRKDREREREGRRQRESVCEGEIQGPAYGLGGWSEYVRMCVDGMRVYCYAYPLAPHPMHLELRGL